DLSDVGLALLGPDGVTQVTLFIPGDFTGNALGSALLSTTFSNSALTNYLDAVAPYSGSIRPRGDLTAFGSVASPQDPNGVWTLVVTDDSGAISGLVDSWSLDFAFAPLSGESL